MDLASLLADVALAVYGDWFLEDGGSAIAGRLNISTTFIGSVVAPIYAVYIASA